jgi:hypothetical protein
MGVGKGKDALPEGSNMQNGPRQGTGRYQARPLNSRVRWRRCCPPPFTPAGCSSDTVGQFTIMRAWPIAGCVALSLVTSACSTAAATRPTTTVRSHALKVAVKTDCDWTESPTSTRSQIAEPVPSGTPWPTLTATGDCHDNVWSVSEQLGDGRPVSYSFPSYSYPPVIDLIVVGFVPLRPGWLPAVLVQTTEGAVAFHTYYLLTDHQSHLSLLTPPTPDYGLTAIRAGTYGAEERYGFSCSLNSAGALQLTLYEVDGPGAGPQHLTLTTSHFQFTASGQLQPDGTSTTREPLTYDGFDFVVSQC